MKVLIIGGGASGMMAALSALENPDNSVTLLERQSRVGKKLLATGNGRCNLTNRNIRLTHYHGQQPEFARFALESFYVGRTLAFFERLGLLTVTEDSGKVYQKKQGKLLMIVSYHKRCPINRTYKTRPTIRNSNSGEAGFGAYALL